MAGATNSATLLTQATRRFTVRAGPGQAEAVIAARGAAREMARELGFGVVDQTRIATAVSEITRNVVMYAVSGTVTISEIRERGRVGLEVDAEDEGPGIPDVQRVLQGGFSTSGGFGRGIAGARTLMDEFHIETQAGVGTRVVMRKWLE